MRSQGFSVLYFELDAVVAAFRTHDIDAYFDEDSSDKSVRTKVNAYEALGDDAKNNIAAALREQNTEGLKHFTQELESTLSRQIGSVYILFLHGPTIEAGTVQEAIRLIKQYGEEGTVESFVRYEVIVRYSNGDEVTGKCESKTQAVKFLNSIG